MRNELTPGDRGYLVRRRGQPACGPIHVASPLRSRKTGVAAVTAAATVLAAAVAWHTGPVTSAQSSTGTVWTGEIGYVQRVTVGNNPGQFRYAWTMLVRWEEAGRIDVTANNGEVVGQLVVLRDQNSTWSANASGTVRFPAGTTTTNQGSGSGRSTIRSAIVYRSLVDDDPLADVLPNGAYAFMGDSSQGFPVTATTVTTNPPATQSQRTESPPPIFMVSAFANAPFNADLPRLPAIQLRGFLTSIANVAGVLQGAGVLDAEYRVLEDDRMVGQYNSTSGAIEHTVTWDIDRTLDVEPTIDLVPLDWRPRGGDEANTIEVTARLPEGTGLEGKFRFELRDISTEPGYAMNAGSNADRDPDLEIVETAEFAPIMESGDVYSVETVGAVSEATITIQASDYGAWGNLGCTVNVDGAVLDCRAADGATYVTLPRDDNNNQIADGWERRHEVAEDANADEDERPEGRDVGDGFSTFEEYRGFLVNGQWVDTDPAEKDVFVHNAMSGHPLVRRGLSLFATASGLRVHQVGPEEYSGVDDRLVNFNRDSHAARPEQGQKAIYLYDGVDPWGRALGRAIGGPGSPNVTDRVLVDLARLQARGLLHVVVNVVAHELAHAVNLYHPGPGVMITECSFSVSGGAARHNGVTSGPMGNLMRYDAGDIGILYYFDSDGDCHLYPVGEDSTFGSQLVDTLQGDGINGSTPPFDDFGRPRPVSGNAGCLGTLRNNMSLTTNEKIPPGGTC